MANTKVSQLTNLNTVDSTTVFLVSSNTTGTLTSYKTTIANVATSILSNLGSNSNIVIAQNGNVSITSNSSYTWGFGTTGNLTLPANTFAINFANGNQASAPLVDVLNTNGLTTVFYPTFVENRANGQIIRGDVDLTYRTDTNTLTAGNISVTGGLDVIGNVTANNFSGNISIVGNIYGTSPNVSLVAGNYTMTFDNTGLLTLPTMGGDEGAEINLGIPITNTTLVDNVKVDVYRDQIRFFDGSTKGAYIDLSQAAVGVGTLLNNRVSGYVNAGTYITMDNLKATVSTGGNRSLQIATVSSSFNAYVNGTYTIYTGGTAGIGTTITVTTTPALAINWNFTSAGDSATYIISDTTNSRCYRVTMLIGPSYNNNMISIERLV